MSENEVEDRHCDDYIDDMDAPDCLRWYLLVNRLLAIENMLAVKMGVDPKLFATYGPKGHRVRVVMASRLGDVGITWDLAAEKGYQIRVMVNELTDFSEQP